MTPRSEWRLAELVTGEADPFATVILSSGLSVDLTGSDEDLFDGLRQTLAMEGRLHDQGVTCELKDDGQNCLDCPMYVADRAEEPRAPLCRLGRDQRLIEERYIEARAAPLTEIAAHAEELSEIGYVGDEYAELLTSVGL